MPTLRPAAVAGMFYPGAAAALRRSVGELLDSAAVPVPRRSWPKALIVPHAGYIYSGAVAASAYARLNPGRDAIRRVVLLGPVHRVPVRGLALPAADAFVDAARLDPGRFATRWSRSRNMPQVCESAAAHALEHSLEVQLPFLQSVLDDFAHRSARSRRRVGGRSRGSPRAAVGRPRDPDRRQLGSVALPRVRRCAPHRSSTPQTDRSRCRITLDHEQACGATPINGFSLCAQRRGLTPELIDLAQFRRHRGRQVARRRLRVVCFRRAGYGTRPMR